MISRIQYYYTYHYVLHLVRLRALPLFLLQSRCCNAQQDESPRLSSLFLVASSIGICYIKKINNFYIQLPYPARLLLLGIFFHHRESLSPQSCSYSAFYSVPLFVVELTSNNFSLNFIKWS